MENENQFDPSLIPPVESEGVHNNIFPFFELPIYRGANPSFSAVVCDAGRLLLDFAKDEPTSSSRVAVVSNTNREEFLNYVSSLQSAGCVLVDTTEIEENIYATLKNDEQQVYVYYTAPYGRVHIAIDRGSASVAQVSRPMPVPAQKSAVFCQYGLNRNYYPHPDKPWDNGMLLAVACADGSLIVIDGGCTNQYDYSQFNDFLHALVGAKSGERLVIASWVLTHLHHDHFYGFTHFMNEFHDLYDLKSICANISYQYVSVTRKSETAVMTRFAEKLNEWYPDCKEIHIHTGQSLQFSDVTLQALYTHEDLIDPVTGAFVKADFNTSGAVFKVSTQDMSMMVLGDAMGCIGGREHENWKKCTDSYLTEVYTEKTLKCDIVQAAHHVLSGVTEAYDLIKARVYLLPQSREGFLHQNDIYPWHRHLKRNLLEGYIFPTYAEHFGTDEEMIFYIGTYDRTVCLQAVNGKVEVVWNPERNIRKLFCNDGKENDI